MVKKTILVIEENLKLFGLYIMLLSYRLSLIPVNIPYKNIDDFDRNK